MITVRNLTKFYGDRRAVHDISFDVADGEIVGFLGPNGAGKTTTIRVLTCYHPATSGQATIAGFDVFKDSMKVRQQVGYLPESVPLYPEMRVREYLAFRGKLRGMSADVRRSAIDRVTTRCWLKDVITRPIGQLSKGYRQRVGLADALLHNPRVLILDEPTVGLDPTQIRETRSLIRELAQEHTVLFSSHILSEVEAVCQRVLVIARGELIAQGTTGALREKMSREWRITTEVKSSEQLVESAIRNLGSMKELQIDSHDGWTRARFVTNRDVRESLHGVFHRNGWPVRELHGETPTLEDFFVKAVLEQQTSGNRRSN